MRHPLLASTALIFAAALQAGAARADIAPDPPEPDIVALVPLVRAAGIDCDRAYDSFEDVRNADADRLRSQGYRVVLLDCANRRRALVAVKPRRWPWDPEVRPVVIRMPDRQPRYRGRPAPQPATGKRG